MDFNHRIAKLYQLTKHLGYGSFGRVCGATHLITGTQVAVKIERVPTSPNSVSLIPYEAAVYKQLGNSVGIPRLHWSGTDNDTNIIVLDVLGPTLEHLRRFCCGSFTLKTTIMLADQMISRLQHVHSRGIIFRDVKPDNFAMGIGKRASTAHLFDFGLAKLFLDPSSGRHIKPRHGLDGLGTPRYASSRVHFGEEQSRRDDMEALGYVLVYLYCGSLPWQGIYAPSIEDKLRRIGEMKEVFLESRTMAGCPPEFTEYFLHCRRLRFEDQPDYDHLRGLLSSVMRQHGWAYDSRFDWLADEETSNGNLLPEKYPVPASLC